MVAHVEAKRGFSLADVDDAAMHDERRAGTCFLDETHVNFLRQ